MKISTLILDFFKAVRYDRRHGTNYTGAWVELRKCDIAIFKGKCKGYRKGFRQDWRKALAELWHAEICPLLGFRQPVGTIQQQGGKTLLNGRFSQSYNGRSTGTTEGLKNASGWRDRFWAYIQAIAPRTAL